MAFLQGLAFTSQDGFLLFDIDENLTEEETETETEEETQEETEENTEENTESSTENSTLIIIDENADVHPYLSSEVEGASLNDLYTVSLSTRNILLLFFLFFITLKLFSWFKSVLYRIMNK